MCFSSFKFLHFYNIITGGPALRELAVSSNNIGDNGISVITEGLQSNRTLRTLNVSVCNFMQKGVYS